MFDMEAMIDILIVFFLKGKVIKCLEQKGNTNMQTRLNIRSYILSVALYHIRKQ